MKPPVILRRAAWDQAALRRIITKRTRAANSDPRGTVSD